MNALLQTLAEEPLLRGALNLALGATTASLVGLLLAAMVRHKAALRQGILIASLIAVAILPLLLTFSGGGLLRLTGNTAQTSRVQQASASPGVAQKALDTSARASAQKFPPPPPPLSPDTRAIQAISPVQPRQEQPGELSAAPLLWGAMWVWIAGSALSAFVTLRAVLLLHRLRRESVLAGLEWEARARQVAEAVRLAQVPQVAFSAGAAVPFAMGGRAPMILLPESARNMEPKEAEAILIHEAAHIVHGHPLLGGLMALVGSVYGWIPSVRGMLTALSDTMEEVCDNHVVRAQGDGRSLGLCLVRAAETAAAKRVHFLPGAAILRGRRGLSRRLEQVLEANRYRETTLTRFGKITAGCALLVCVSLCAAMRIAPAGAEPEAQQKVQQKAENWPSYFPTTPRTEWVYQATYAGQPQPSTHILRVRRWVPLKNGSACAEIETNYDGRRGGFLYHGLRADGYYAYANAFIGMPGVSENEAPIPEVKFPVKKGQTWTWREPWRGQTAADDNGNAPDTTNWGTDCTATIEATDEPVTVPEGQYQTIRVRIERVSNIPDVGKTEEIVWYAKGVGVVRREGRKPGQAEPVSVFALTKFIPGSLLAATPENILLLVRTYLAGNPPRSLREIDLSSGAFQSRFAAAQWSMGQRLIYRVTGQGVLPFAPQSPQDWNLLFLEDRIEFLEDPIEQPPLGGTVSRWAMLKDMGVLIAESLGYETDGKLEVNQVTTRNRPDNGSEIAITVGGRMRSGASLNVRVRLEVSKQGAITNLSVAASR